jgi:predicted membrane protein
VALGVFYGGVGALAALGVVFATVVVAVTTIDLPLEGPIGDRTEHPTTVLDLEETYRQSIGELEVDLRDLALPAGTTEVAASVGIGELTVYVPDDVRVEVDADVTGGEADIFGESMSGRNIEGIFQEEGVRPNAPVLDLDVDVGFGDLEVRRG